MKHFGDITKIKGIEVPIVDIITGGSPCQDLSVAAGRREGLDGKRSGLFMEQIRIIKEIRENDKRNRGTDVDIRFLRPRFMVWENVTGAFSSNKGEDFRCVLEETARVVDKNATIPRLEGKQKWTPSGCVMGDGWSIAWRVHDSQFWGVPQRRKRIALVADFGGYTAPEILFEREGLQRDIEKSGEQRKGLTTTTEGCPDKPSAFTLKIRGGVEIDSYGKRAGKGALVQTELSATIGVSQDQTLIQVDKNAVSLDCSHADDVVRISDSVPCMQGRQVKGGNNVLQDSVVRRLTPLECERLQGFPDGWTDIGEWVDSKGKKHKEADSPRYRALGNSIALPFWRWLAERIVSEYDRQTTMASLFDGIGGFPLVFSDFGCEPLWASEIEEFPIAVTKMRFK